MADIYQRFKKVVNKHELISDGDLIIAGISGGVDSVVLLDLLDHFQKEKKIDFELIAAHLNHMTRRGASDRDQALVEKLCKERSIRLETKKIDVEKKSSKSGKSFEMVARKIRYQFFNSISPGGIIATGHTRDDHIETILLRIFQGTGLKGLEGISYRIDNVIHPLIFATKQQLYEYAEEHQLEFNQDRTNFENSCQRNVIRNQILPLVKKEINPNHKAAISRLSTIAREIDDFMERGAAKKLNQISRDKSSWFYSLDIGQLSAFHPALSKQIILVASNRLIPHSIIAYKTFEQLTKQLSRETEGQLLELNSDLAANFDRGRLFIYNKRVQNWNKKVVAINSSFETDSFIFTNHLVDKGWNKQDFENVEYIDYDKLEGELVLRHWRKGDKFRPLNFKHSKKLSDLFIDRKIPNFKKHHLPILVNNQRIVWVCGLRLSDHFKIDEKTENFLKLEYKEK
jgi:tRNA(Ile)-lysidine synthase